MKKNILWLLLGIAALAALIVGALFGYKYLSKFYTPEENKAPTSAHQATDFTVLDGAGEGVSLSSKFGGPVVLNFWATWCGPCQSEMPAFDAMHKSTGTRSPL